MARPLPRINADTKPYWDAAADSRLVYQHCTSCNHAQFPPRRICAACGSTELEWKQSAGRGKIATFSVVHRAPTEAFRDLTPFVLALVDLDEGFRLMVNVSAPDPSAIQIGGPIRIVFEAMSDGSQLPQAELVV